MKYKLVDLAFDPSQKRDPDGKWTKSPKTKIGKSVPGFFSDADMDYLDKHASEAKKGGKAERDSAVAARDEAALEQAGRNISAVVKVPSYADVAFAYDWASRDTKGSDKTPAAVVSIHQQGLAQIKAKYWSSSLTPDSSEDESYAAGLWEQYQNPQLYGLINKTLRTKKTEPGDPDYKTVKKITDTMFAKASVKTTEPMTVFRALRSGDIDWWKKLAPGTTFEDDGIISTTAHNRFAAGWLQLDETGNEVDAGKVNDVVMEIRVPTGTPIVGGDPQFIETMLRPGSKFKIISSEQRRETHVAMPLENSDDVATLPPLTYTHVIAEVTP